MSNFWSKNQKFSEATLEQVAELFILNGILGNNRIDEKMPPEVIVKWCREVTAVYVDKAFSGADSGIESIAEFEKEQGMSITDYINKRLEEEGSSD